MTNSWLTSALEKSRALGFLGPGPVEPHIAHAQGYLSAWNRFRDTPPTNFLDLGSGGGVPGFILLDSLHVPATLLDAMEKRCRFLVEQLDLPGAPPSVSVVTGRAEVLARQMPYQESFDWVVVRSFGQPANTAECASRFLKLGGLLTVSEPPNTPSEDRWPQEGLAQLGLRRLTEDGPGTGYVVIEKIAPTPEQFPRRDGVPAKKLLFGS